ncbi:MAG: XrtA/PEP-CTERM system TPR-repeat protein PrsT [Pseudomonadota bacterium]
MRIDRKGGVGRVERSVPARRRLDGFVSVMFAILLTACSGEPDAETRMQKARELVAEAQFQDAVNELKQALLKDGNQPKVRSMLGQIYFEVADYDGAVKELTRAMELSNNEYDLVIVPILAQALLHLGDYEALDKLNVDALDDPGRSVAQAAKGLSLLYQNNVAAAADVLETATFGGTTSPFARVATARLLVAERDYDGAKAVLQGVIEDHGDYAPAYNLLGDIEAALGNPAAAEASYSEVITLSRRSFDARLNRAMMRIYQGEFAGAKKDIAVLRQFFGRAGRTHPGIKFATGIIELQSKQLRKAGKSFEAVTEFSEIYPLSYYYLALIDLETGNLEGALQNVYRFLALAPRSVIGPKLAARLELMLGNYHQAEYVLQPALNKQPEDVESLNMMASALLAQGKSRQGLEVLEQIVELEGDSSIAKARLGAGELASGDQVLAIENLEAALAISPSYQWADALIVLNYLERGRTRRALAAAKAYRARSPESSLAYNLLGRVHLERKEYGPARDAFKHSKSLDNGSVAANEGLAQIARTERDFAQMRAYYSDVLEQSPGELSTIMRVADTYVLEGDESNMLRVVESAIAEHPEALEPRLYMARYLIGKDRLVEAELHLDALSNAQRDRPESLATMGSLQLATGRYQQAVLTIGRLIGMQYDVSQNYYLRAKAHAGLGEDVQAVADLDKALELDPEHFYARLAHTRLLEAMGATKSFAEGVAVLQKRAPQNRDVLRLEAARARDSGKGGYAVELLQKLHRDSPGSDTASELAALYLDMGNVNGARDTLLTWLQQEPDHLYLREQLAAVYLAAGQKDRALDQYRTMLDTDSDNVTALNNLAWYSLDSQPAAALEYAKRAFVLAPDSPWVMDTLAMAQMHNGNAVEARRTMSRAREIAPDAPALRFHEAQILAQVGFADAAADSLGQLLSSERDFAERAEAEAFLRGLR